MTNLLLAEGITEFIPLIIVGSFLLLGIIVFIIIKKVNDPTSKRNAKIKTSEIDVTKSMGLKIPFLNNAENNFLYNFQRVLPDEYVVFPKVAFGAIATSGNNRPFYDAIANKTLDFVVFLRRNMQPVVVLDINDRTGLQASIEDDEKLLHQALANIRLPIVSYEIRQDYDLPALLGRFLDALDPLAIADLKKNRG